MALLVLVLLAAGCAEPLATPTDPGVGDPTPGTLCDRIDAVIRHAIETGEVDLDLARDESAEPPTDLDEMLRLAREAGGIDALEQLLGDATPAEDA